MARGKEFVTLGSLLEERGDTEQDEEILDRIKFLAQEHLPDGWTQWEVSSASREAIFGDKIEPNILNKLVFALPTVGLARAFNPEAEHLSEKGYRDIRFKLLDWAFARALILSPPAIANRIRGSALNTELFKESVAQMEPLLHTRAVADKILSGRLSGSEETRRRRRSRSIATEESQRKRKRTSISPSTAQDMRIEALEKKMEGMFALLLDKLENRPSPYLESDKENVEEVSEDSEDSEDNESWVAPAYDSYPSPMSPPHLHFTPSVKEADPLIPEPDPEIKREGIECQRFNKEGWNRIRYKEVEKSLHAAPVFSTLKVNMELGSLVTQPSPWLAKQEGILGTITHGLLLQRKETLAKGLNEIVQKCPSAGEELRALLSKESQFKEVSDNLLQYVCAHRAEAIELRRKSFRARNDILNGVLHNISPSSTSLFDEQKLNCFIKDNGGSTHIFPGSKFDKKEKTTFRKTTRPSPSAKRKQASWQSRPTFTHTNSTGRPSTSRQTGSSKSSKYRNFAGKDKKSRKNHKY